MGNFHVFYIFLHFRIFYNMPNYIQGEWLIFSFCEINIHALTLKINVKKDTTNDDRF